MILSGLVTSIAAATAGAMSRDRRDPRVQQIVERIHEAKAASAIEGLPDYDYIVVMPSDWYTLRVDAAFAGGPLFVGGVTFLGLPLVVAYSAEDREREARGERPLVVVP